MSTDRALRLQVVLQAIDRATAPLRGIGRGSKEAANQLKATLDSLKALKNQQQAIGEFRKLTGELKSSAEQLKLMRQRVAELRAAQAAGGQATKAHAAELAAAEKAVARATKAYEAQERAVAATKQRLAALGLRNVAADESRLGREIAETSRRADQQRASVDRLRGAWAQAQAARRRYDQTMARAGQLAGAGAGTAATAYAVSRPAVAMARAFMPNEDATVALRNTEMQADGSISADFERIKDLATDLGNRLPGTTADFLEMMTMLRRQGIASKDVLGGLGEATAYLGVQLKLPAADAAAFAAKMQDATQTSAGDMMGMLDQIQRAYNLGVDPTNMLAGITKMAPAMSVLRKNGLDATKDLLPLLVMMDQAGMAGEAAGNAIRKVFQASVSADRREKANDALQGTGIRLDLTDGKGEFGGMEKLFSELKKLDKLTSERRGGVIKALFGDDAETLQVVTTLMSKGVTGMQETTAKLEAQADLRKRVNEQLGTLSNRVEAAQGNAENALAAFGDAMAPGLKEVVDWLGEVASGMGAWARENPKLAAGIGYTVAVVATLLAAIGGLLLAVASLLGPLAIARYALAFVGLKGAKVATVLRTLGSVGWRSMGLLAKGIMIVGRALLANPIGLAIAAIATAAYLIYENWEPIKAFFLDLWESVKKIFWNAIDALLGPMRLLRDAFAAIGLNVPEIPRFGDAAAAAGSPVKVDDRPPLPAGAGQPRPVVVAGANMPVTINVPPGSDAKDIAREFERLQAKLQRDQAARARSTLHDAY